MPFKSKAQRRKFAQLLVAGTISDETYEEWNRSTGKKELPERLHPLKGRKVRGRKAGTKRTGAKKTATRKTGARKTRRRTTRTRTTKSRRKS